MGLEVRAEMGDLVEELTAKFHRAESPEFLIKKCFHNSLPIMLAEAPQKMIILCELSFLGRAHVPFNAGLVATVQAAFPKEALSFYGAFEHVEELKKEVGQRLAASIAWREIVPSAPGTIYSRRFFRELNIIRHLLSTLPQDQTSRLVLTSAYPSTVLALKVAQAFRHRNIPVQIVLHGMSGVVGKRYRRPILRFQDMKTALTLFGNYSIKYIVLERSIRETVVNNFPSLLGKIDALEHPISPSQAELPAIDLIEPIRFGFLGLADKAKGFPLFVELANHVTGKYERRTEFHAIGHLPRNGMVAKGTEALITKPGTRLMSRANFHDRASLLHFVVLPHDPATYTLTASGVLLDAIAWGKPVIARKIPIFEAMFEKHGDIGYLFHEDNELKDIVERIVQSADKSHYHRQVLNLRNARNSRAPDTLAVSYRAMCK